MAAARVSPLPIALNAVPRARTAPRAALNLFCAQARRMDASKALQTIQSARHVPGAFVRAFESHELQNASLAYPHSSGTSPVLHHALILCAERSNLPLVSCLYCCFFNPHPSLGSCLTLCACMNGAVCIGGFSQPCPYNTYNQHAGQSGQLACTACPPNSVTNRTGANSESLCYCLAGYFGVRRGGAMACEPCGLGSRCDSVGVQLEQMALLPGYWRFHQRTPDVRLCPGRVFDGTSSCLGGAGVGNCVNGTGGILCQSCEQTDHFYTTKPASCTPCSELFERTDVRLAIMAILALVLSVLLLLACSKAVVTALVEQAPATVKRIQGCQSRGAKL